MRIRHLSFLGVRGLDGVRQDLPRTSDTDLIVVHGGYSSGKTSFLDAIAAAKEKVAEYGSPDARWDGLVGSSTGAAKVSIQWELSDEERARYGVSDALAASESILGRGMAKEDHSLTLRGVLGQDGDATRGSVHYLHDSRDLDGPMSFGSEDAALRLRLTTRNSKFSDLYDLLDHGERSSQRALAAERFAQLCPRLQIAGLKRFGTSFYPMFKDGAGERRYETLSASERQAFILALYTAKTPIVDSLVLVDAPELGFGDSAVEYLRAILRWTTRTQVIAATGCGAVRSMSEVAHVLELRS